jgi:SlyX protein
MEERIFSIETRIAFYEKTIDDLSLAIYKQQKEIDILRKKVETLDEFFNTSANIALKDQTDESPPPHY